MSASKLLNAATGIQYNIAEDVVSLGHLLIARLQREGAFSSNANPSGTIGILISEASAWLKGVDRTIDTMPLGDTLDILEYYDILHRVVFHREADTSFFNGYYLKAVDECISGNHDVNECRVFDIVSNAITVKRNPAYFGKPLQWYSSTLYNWYNDCRASNSFESLPLDNALQRVCGILKTDLTAYVAKQSVFKQRLADNYSVFLNNTYNFGLHELQALLQFVRTAKYQYLSAEDAERQEIILLQKLSKNPQLNCFASEAYALDLQNALAT